MRSRPVPHLRTGHKPPKTRFVSCFFESKSQMHWKHDRDFQNTFWPQNLKCQKYAHFRQNGFRLRETPKRVFIFRNTFWPQNVKCAKTFILRTPPKNRFGGQNVFSRFTKRFPYTCWGSKRVLTPKPGLFHYQCFADGRFGYRESVQLVLSG